MGHNLFFYGGPDTNWKSTNRINLNCLTTIL